ncbi:MAG: SH3 domain-containing protein [Verrucomicrobiota bacterium]
MKLKSWIAACAAWMMSAAVCFAAAEGVEARFDAANRLYEQGQYVAAAAAYEQIASQGRAAPSVLFNEGNAWFKAGQPGRAIAAYRMAGRMSPRDPDVQTNLRYVRSQVQGPRLAVTRPEEWLGRLTLNEWAGLAAAAFWAWMGLLVAGQWRPGLVVALRWATYAWFGAFLATASCLAFDYRFLSAESAVVIRPDVEVRQGPLPEAQAAFRLQDGAEVRVLDHKDGWAQVTVGDRRTGWVKSEELLNILAVR